jgi:hypothetical protein
MRVLTIALMVVLTGCATQRGNDRHAQHAADQVRMVAVQREAMVQEAQAESATQVALVEALSRVAASNPDHAPAVTVALAVIGVRGADAASGDTPVLALQRQQNEALEWTKALAPTVGGLVSGLGIAAINAETQRNQSDNNREIMLGDQQQNARIVDAVAGLGTVASNNSGITAGGNIYQVSDNGYVDQSTNTDNSENQTVTSQGDLNTGSQTDDSFNSSAMGVADTPATYLGLTGTVQELIEYLANLGAPYTLTLNGAVVASSTAGTGTPMTIDCNSVMFSPRPAQCT